MTDATPNKSKYNPTAETNYSRGHFAVTAIVPPAVRGCKCSAEIFGASGTSTRLGNRKSADTTGTDGLSRAALPRAWGPLRLLRP
eukprot:3413632-Pyramimonas_sp.AAC.1